MLRTCLPNTTSEPRSVERLARCAIVLVGVLSGSACRGTGGGPGAPVSPKAAGETSLYLFSCSPTIERVNLQELRTERTWNLEVLAHPHVLWGPGVDGCPIGSPIFDGESRRIFFTTPRSPSENPDGHRPEVILGIRLDLFTITDIIAAADWPLERAALALAPAQRLLVSQRSFDRKPGLGNGAVFWIDVAVPGHAQLTSRNDGVSFTEHAVFEEGVVWDENRAIRFTPKGPVQEVLELDSLLGDARGDALLSYSAVDEKTNRRFIVAQLYEAAYNRALFSLPERGPVMSYAVATISPPSVRVARTDLEAAAVHLISNGQEILAEEKVQAEGKWRNSGRLVVTSAATMTSRADWQANRLQGEGVRYLCERGGLLLFAAGPTLLVLREGSSNATEVALANPADQYTRCIPSAP